MEDFRSVLCIILLFLCFVLVVQDCYEIYPPDWVERITSKYLQYTTLSSSDARITFRLENVSEQRIVVHDYDRVISEGGLVIGNAFTDDFDGTLAPRDYIVVTLIFPSPITDSAEFQFIVTDMRGEVLETQKGEI